MLDFSHSYISEINTSPLTLNEDFSQETTFSFLLAQNFSQLSFKDAVEQAELKIINKIAILYFIN